MSDFFDWSSEELDSIYDESFGSSDDDDYGFPTYTKQEIEAIRQIGEDVERRRGTYEFYVEWMEETCYDFEKLRYVDDREKKLLEPHLDKLKKFCKERLDELERIEKMKCGAYLYFIWLLKKNNLNLRKTVSMQPYIYESYMGLINRTHKRLMKESEMKNKM